MTKGYPFTIPKLCIGPGTKRLSLSRIIRRHCHLGLIKIILLWILVTEISFILHFKILIHLQSQTKGLSFNIWHCRWSCNTVAAVWAAWVPPQLGLAFYWDKEFTFTITSTKGLSFNIWHCRWSCLDHGSTPGIGSRLKDYPFTHRIRDYSRGVQD